jgi:hypothetical protein
MLPGSEGTDRLLQDAGDARYKMKSSGCNNRVVSETIAPKAPRRRVLKAPQSSLTIAVSKSNSADLRQRVPQPVK